MDTLAPEGQLFRFGSGRLGRFVRMMVCAAVLFSFLVNPAVADSTSPWPSQHVGKSARLSNSAINTVYMDRQDYVWLGTWDGLDRYDGSNITVYKPDPFVKGSISNNVVRDVLEDGNDNLWVVTHLGINKYDRRTDSFKTYFDVLTDVPFLEYNIRACVGSDSAVWVSVMGKGISRYSESDDRFVPLTFKGIDRRWLTAVVGLGQHLGLQYFLGNDGKIACVVNNIVVFVKDLSHAGPFLNHKFLRIRDRYYLAAVNNAKQLLMFDLSSLDHAPQAFDMAPLTISTLSENLDHTSAWLGSESGDIMKINLEKGIISVTPMNAFFPAFSRARIKILSITETKQDIVWIGTDGDGVHKFLTRPKPFYSIAEGDPVAGQLSHSIIRSVYEDENGVLYVGTRGGGLNVIDPASGKSTVKNTSNGLSNDAVLSIREDHDGNIWVGLDGEGIDMIEAGTGKIFHFPRDFTNDNDLAFGAVYSICVDAFNDIWLGTSGYGVIHLKVVKAAAGKYQLKHYDQLSHPGKARPMSINSNVVYAIVEEKPNLLWFGTRGGGIYRYNALTKDIEAHIQGNANEKNRLSNNDVLSLYIDKQEQLWIGSSGGLDRLSLGIKPYRIDHFTQYQGLPNNTIHGILEDAGSNIWLSTNQGLVMYNRSRNTFKNFDPEDGLKNGEFADGAAFQSKTSSRLYFGGINGLDIVHPEKLYTRNYFPRLALTGFQVRNADVHPDDNTQILTRNIDETGLVTLNHDQNFVTFFFTTLDYWSKQKSEYRYLLEGFDKDWNNIGQQQSITLTNIPPGTYKLNIDYTNENGRWGTPKVLTIVVNPPFWKTGWAYGVYAMLVIGMQLLIVVYVRQRTRQKKGVAMEKFKAQQLKELNDYKLSFFTNIAHEFRTPLTLIMGPVTSLLHRNSGGDDQRQLKTIYSNSLRLQKLIDELMLFRKIESGKDELTLSSLDIVRFAQEIVESFHQHAAERDIHVEFYPEPETLPCLVDHRKIEKIIINLLSNAIKYSPAGGMVSLALKTKGKNVIIEVCDEGLGITTENKSRIFDSFYRNPVAAVNANGIEMSAGIGLSLTRSLVQMHRGKIELDTKPGGGSTFRVTIPITKESYADLPPANTMLTSPQLLAEKVAQEFETNHFLEPLPASEGTVVEKREYSLLVVDDHAGIVSMLDNILRPKYNVYKASDGKKAMTVLEEERIDLVISDVVMPNMDGLELCRNIKENIQTSHIPVILLTAKGDIEHRIEGLQVGADSYIPKPFHPEHLFIRVEKLIERMELIRNRFGNLANMELNQMVPGIGQKDDDFFSKVTRCISAHLGQSDLNANTIADEVGMSKASLYKKVKTITGLTPHGLIKQYRLKKAADLLRTSTMSVSEVIDETGFNSRSYFYKSFNEMFKMHPKDVVREETTKAKTK